MTHPFKVGDLVRVISRYGVSINYDGFMDYLFKPETVSIITEIRNSRTVYIANKPNNGGYSVWALPVSALAPAVLKPKRRL